MAGWSTPVSFDVQSVPRPVGLGYPEAPLSLVKQCLLIQYACECPFNLRLLAR